MIITSKIKEVFGDELIRMIAAVCQTRRIQSNKEKMLTVYGLLNEAGIEYEPLGDATNRLAIQRDAYAFKIALDQAGYKDNWMEYALSDELQPYVTHTFETNGFIAVAECVKSLSEDEYFARKSEMSKILDAIGGEYLLGDVGITKKNYKNWGVRDSGDIVILDYAYVHRATEDLFLCTTCGEMLRYNEAFTELGCYGRDGCGTVFKYENKRPQIPDSEIQRVIDSAKAKSILMSKAFMESDEAKANSVIADPNTIIIKSYDDYENYLKEANKMYDYGEQDGVGAVLNLMNAVKAGKSVQEALKENIGDVQNKKLVIESVVQDEDFYDDDEPQETIPVPVVVYDEDEDPEDITSDEDPHVVIDKLLERMKQRNSLTIGEEEEEVVPNEPYEDEEGKVVDIILQRMNAKRLQGIHNQVLETTEIPHIELSGVVIGDDIVQEPELEPVVLINTPEEVEEPETIIEEPKVDNPIREQLIQSIVEKEDPVVEVVTIQQPKPQPQSRHQTLEPKPLKPSKYDDFDPEAHMEMSNTLKKHLMNESNKSRHIVLKNNKKK